MRDLAVVRDYFVTKRNQLSMWATNNVLGIFIFNLVLMLLVLLYNAGYFAPFFPLTINIIVMACFMLSYLLFKSSSRVLFVFALSFWLLAAFFRTLGINIWAERTALYSFEAFVIGFVILVFEVLISRVKNG